MKEKITIQVILSMNLDALFVLYDFTMGQNILGVCIIFLYLSKMRLINWRSWKLHNDFHLNVWYTNGPEGETHRKWQDLLQLCKNSSLFFSIQLSLCFYNMGMTLLSRVCRNRIAIFFLMGTLFFYVRSLPFVFIRITVLEFLSKPEQMFWITNSMSQTSFLLFCYLSNKQKNGLCLVN